MSVDPGSLFHLCLPFTSSKFINYVIVNFHHSEFPTSSFRQLRHSAFVILTNSSHFIHFVTTFPFHIPQLFSYHLPPFPISPTNHPPPTLPRTADIAHSPPTSPKTYTPHCSTSFALHSTAFSHSFSQSTSFFSRSSRWRLFNIVFFQVVSVTPFDIIFFKSSR